MNHQIPEVPAIFDWFIHLLELSVVLSMAVMTFILMKYKKKPKIPLGPEIKAPSKE